MTPEELAHRRAEVNRKTLHVLLVLSFINTGIYLLTELMWGIAMPALSGYITSHPDMYPAEMGIMVERVLAIPRWYFLLSALLDCASVAGLILMWRLRKNGFHCYTLSKLLLMMLPLLFLDRSYVGVGNIMIAVFFIVYYFFLLKALGAFGGQSSDKPSEEEAPSEEQTSEEQTSEEQTTE